MTIKHIIFVFLNAFILFLIVFVLSRNFLSFLVFIPVFIAVYLHLRKKYA